MTPLPFPEAPAGVARVQFEPERVDYAAPEASGRQGGVQAGWPLWAATWEIDPSDPASADLWRAFLARLRGRLRRFHAGDTNRPFPRLYPVGFAAIPGFGGSASGWSQAIDGDGNSLITLNGLPAGLQLSIGDYIGWKWDVPAGPPANRWRRTMARLVAPATASGGGVLTAMVEPPIDPRVVPSLAIAHLDRPLCTMQLIPEKSSLGPIGRGGAIGGATLVAIQDLRL